MEILFGTLLYGDLKENTLTIEMDEAIKLRSGNYAIIRIDSIIDKEKLETLIQDESL